MKKFIQSIIPALLFFSFAMGQGRKMDALSDTVAYKNNKAEISKFGLRDLSLSPHKKHWRFWIDQVVDIWTDDGNVYYGSILNYIYKIDKKRSILTKTEAIDTTKSKSLIILFKRLQIDTIPSDNKIKGWNYQIADGDGVDIAYSDADIYSYKKYFCPGLQSMNQAKVISDFFNQLSTTLALRKKEIAFIHELPLGRYSLGMMIIENTVHMRPKGGSVLRF